MQIIHTIVNGQKDEDQGEQLDQNEEPPMKNEESSMKNEEEPPMRNEDNNLHNDNHSDIESEKFSNHENDVSNSDLDMNSYHDSNFGSPKDEQIDDPVMEQNEEAMLDNDFNGKADQFVAQNNIPPSMTALDENNHKYNNINNINNIINNNTDNQFNVSTKNLDQKNSQQRNYFNTLQQVFDERVQNLSNRNNEQLYIDTSPQQQYPYSFFSNVSPNSAKRQSFPFPDTDSPYQNFSGAFITHNVQQPIHSSNNQIGNYMRDSESLSSHSSNSSRSPLGNIMNLSSNISKKIESKKRKRFTEDEDSKIIDSVYKRKNPKSNHIDWDAVTADCRHFARTKEQLRTRYYNIKNKRRDKSDNQSVISPAIHLPPNPFDNLSNISIKSNKPTSSQENNLAHHIVPISGNNLISSESVGSGSVSSISGGENVSLGGIPHGEHSEESFSNFSDGLGSCGNQSRTKRSSSRSLTRKRTIQIQTDPAHDYISQIQKELEDSKNLLREAIQTNKEQQRKMDNQTEELRLAQIEFSAQKEKFPKTLLEFLRKSAQFERQLAARKLRDDSERLGTIVPRINGINIQEQWVAGESFIELQRELKELDEQKNLIEQKRKVIQKLKMNIKKDLEMADDQLFELNEQDAVYRLRLSDIKKEEQLLQQRLKQLDIEKRSHIREIKRQRDEDRSRFNGFQTIGPDGRYFLMKLIGRGGFSEVYQAYDIKDLRVVACKIHQLNSSWKDSRKENYIKHVLRECQIHKKISHPRVVQMYDTFVFDENTYVTVLEYCSGYDLDMLLKKHSITEKKAQNIISQVFCGLKYLSESPRKIIHFDLKPANILYCNGEIKITDFGLSKMMEDEDSIDLTSQGAGTYWYLPPECFEVQNIPKISSKVDVWSAGVIFYQMLYGKKPFGNDLSQREVLQQRVISNARNVIFPSKPVVSQEAKEFIQLCLTYDQEQRPDVEMMYRHKYLRQNLSKSR